jgi:hypothetical protein
MALPADQLKVVMIVRAAFELWRDVINSEPGTFAIRCEPVLAQASLAKTLVSVDYAFPTFDPFTAIPPGMTAFG